MGNKVARIILGIVIACGILVGVYFILPGDMRNPLTATLQSTFDSNYDQIVNKVKGAAVPKNKDKTFEKTMAGATKNAAWTIKKIAVDGAGDGAYEVYADGYKCTVSVPSETSSDSMVTSTNAHVRLIFKITKKGSEIKIGDKVVEAGKTAYPDEINVDTKVYKVSDKDAYYQKTLNFLASHSN